MREADKTVAKILSDLENLSVIYDEALTELAEEFRKYIEGNCHCLKCINNEQSNRFLFIRL